MSRDFRTPGVHSFMTPEGRMYKVNWVDSRGVKHKKLFRVPIGEPNVKYREQAHIFYKQVTSAVKRELKEWLS